MEFERPHRSGTSSSELFICFTSRPSFSSSSSMKLSSKPILSPGRSDKCREPTLSFSSSLNRRLGSMKGGQSSPMFKKRGCGFENAEPTSPKVTCIGQVRVKTKKQGKKMMSLRKREPIQGGILQEKKDEECLPHRNQKWVHLPLTICETLRGFGAEFNCFLPCGGKSCSSRGRGEKRRTVSSCGAVFAKWLMALQEGEEEKRREMTVLVGEEGQVEKGDAFDEIVIEEEKRKMKEGIEEYEEERYSICIPPKNALLLMRCRSEPLRMSALANRFWDSPIQDEDEEEEGDSEEEEQVEEEMKSGMEEEHERNQLSEQCGSDEVDEDEDSVKEECDSAEIVEDHENSMKEEESCLEEQCISDCLHSAEEEIPFEEEHFVTGNVEDEDENSVWDDQWGLAELFGEEENPLIATECVEDEKVAEEEQEVQQEQVLLTEGIVTEDCFEDLLATEGEEREFEEKKEGALEVEGEEKVNAMETEEEEEEEMKKVEEEEGNDSKERRGSTVLPDCLLMMMFEPKLSMEVSKETWVCSTDFVKPRSQRQADIKSKASVNVDIKTADTAQQQNEKLSVSYPAPPSMTSMIEQRLMNAAAYEPFVLTRCKSEPLRSSAKLIIPEACFWKNQPPSGVGC